MGHFAIVLVRTADIWTLLKINDSRSTRSSIKWSTKRKKRIEQQQLSKLWNSVIFVNSLKRFFAIRKSLEDLCVKYMKMASSINPQPLGVFECHHCSVIPNENQVNQCSRGHIVCLKCHTQYRRCKVKFRTYNTCLM